MVDWSLMTGTSPQVKEWVRRPAPVERDVRAALTGLPEEELLRLCAIARLRARSLPDGMSWSYLLHEAVLRGLRAHGRGLLISPLSRSLAGVMRSLRDEQWRRHRRQDTMKVITGLINAMKAEDVRHRYGMTDGE